jgi:SAM-dependent methyltransferase
MLKEAALLTLELAMDLNQDKIILQDASPYNIFFDGTRPVFIDFGSFTQATDDYLWGAYEQFCNFFFFPLYMYSSGNSSIPNALLKDCYKGVPVADMMQTLGFIDKLRMPGYLARVTLPEFILKRSGKLRYGKEAQSLYSKFSDRIDVSRIRAKFLDRLYRNVCGIRLPEPASHWTEYYEDSDEKILECKKKELRNIMSRLAPRSVLDLGCNQGVFSILAAESGARVVASDSDHDCISRLFEISKKKKYDILPLVMDVLNPSPGIGWRSVQYKPSQERLKCEMVLALALIHHLVFVGGQDFERIVGSIKEFQMKWSIIEYVDQSDPKAQLLPRRPSVDYSWYTLDNFLTVLRANYAEVKILTQLSETRTLILASK